MYRCDTIVVGAGSAGCVLAHRLVTRGIDVTLVESPSSPAPKTDRIRPSRWLHLLGSGDDWNFGTKPCPGLVARRLTWPRGRGLGGSSRINAMIWFPPTDEDLQNLSEAGGSLWDVVRLRQSYSAIESIVRPEPPRWISRASQYFMDAAGSVERAAPMIYRRVNRAGQRWTANELLDQASAPSQGKLRIVRGSVSHVVFDGDTAVGVQTDASSEPLRCDHGVVLCAGTIATPAILMRGGIGPGSVLRKLGIDVRRDCDRVGADLQDHLLMPVVFGLDPKARFEPSPTTRDIVRWQVLGRGPITSNIAECGGLFDDAALQIHVTPTHYLTHPQVDSRAAMTIGVNVTQPESCGRLSIVSTDPAQPPAIEPNYLNETSDLENMVRGVRLCRQLAAADPLAAWHRGELLPGAKRSDDESIARSISRYAQTLYHPVGTCAFGSGPDSVLDSTLAVRGTDQLWVADASVLPTLTVGNPNATVMTIAVHFADLLLSQLGR